MNNLKILDNCYALRYAAGRYWLLDTEQSGVPYKKPLCLNEVGARIWEMMTGEYTCFEICRILAEEYGVSQEEITEDVLMYVKQLKAYGVKIED